MREQSGRKAAFLPISLYRHGVHRLQCTQGAHTQKKLCCRWDEQLILRYCLALSSTHLDTLKGWLVETEWT